MSDQQGATNLSTQMIAERKQENFQREGSNHQQQYIINECGRSQGAEINQEKGRIIEQDNRLMVAEIKEKQIGKDNQQNRMAQEVREEKRLDLSNQLQQLNVSMLAELLEVSDAQMRLRIPSFFSQKVELFASYQIDELKQIIKRTVIALNSRLIPQKGQQCTYSYPPASEMKRISLELLPDFATTVSEMNQVQLQEFFKTVMQEAQKVKHAKLVNSEYLDLHPFQIKLNAGKDLTVIPPFDEMMEIVKIQDPELWTKLKQQNIQMPTYEAAAKMVQDIEDNLRQRKELQAQLNKNEAPKDPNNNSQLVQEKNKNCWQMEDKQQSVRCEVKIWHQQSDNYQFVSEKSQNDSQQGIYQVKPKTKQQHQEAIEMPAQAVYQHIDSQPQQSEIQKLLTIQNVERLSAEIELHQPNITSQQIIEQALALPIPVHFPTEEVTQQQSIHSHTEEFISQPKIVEAIPLPMSDAIPLPMQEIIQKISEPVVIQAQEKKLSPVLQPIQEKKAQIPKLACGLSEYISPIMYQSMQQSTAIAQILRALQNRTQQAQNEVAEQAEPIAQMSTNFTNSRTQYPAAEEQPRSQSNYNNTQPNQTKIENNPYAIDLTQEYVQERQPQVQSKYTEQQNLQSYEQRQQPEIIDIPDRSEMAEDQTQPHSAAESVDNDHLQTRQNILKRSYQETSKSTIPVYTQTTINVSMKKGKFNIPELRKKLMNRLPMLKESIELLSDQEIENVMVESFKHSKKKDGTRKMITRGEEARMGRNQTSFDQNDHQELYSNHQKGKTTELFEFKSGEDRPKKSRTIMLIHTEEESQSDRPSRRRKLQNGNVEKCDCDCCQRHKQTIPEPFRQLLKYLSQSQE